MFSIKKLFQTSLAASLAGAGSIAGTAGAASNVPVSVSNATDQVDALNGVFGKHAGMRASHAKGFCISGSFKPSKEAQKFDIPLLKSKTALPVNGRFSIGGGNPKAPDNGKSIRGLALAIAGKSDNWELAFISAPHFFASTPDEFVAFLQVRAPVKDGKPDTVAVDAFSKAHPNTTLQAKYLAAQQVPASYATVPYWSTHTFLLKQGKATQAVRWRFEPKAGRMGLSDDQAKAAGSDFLQGDFEKRLAQGTVQFELMAQLPQAGDNLLDPTQAWPSDRKEIAFGTLSITHVQGQSCDTRMFVPTLLPKGISPSDDPILHARAAAYGVSLGRRLQK